MSLMSKSNCLKSVLSREKSAFLLNWDLKHAHNRTFHFIALQQACIIYHNFSITNNPHTYNLSGAPSQISKLSTFGLGLHFGKGTFNN